MVHSPSPQHRTPAESPRFPAANASETVKQTLVEMEALCRARRARLTPIRRRVLEVLLYSQKPLGAYDLASALASHGRRMAPITVYRALDFLIEQGLAHRIASRNAYVAGTGNRGTTAFLVCESCGDATEIASPEVAATVLKVLTERGYQPHARILEITGRCAHCQDIH